LEGQVEFKKIVFDHEIHFADLKRGKQLRCTSCHSQIVQGDHIIVTNSTCFICHFKESEHYPKISKCSHCHLQKDLVSEKSSRFNHSLVYEKNLKCEKCHSHIIVGDGEVLRENCFKCHFETERLNKYDDTDLMHIKHIAENKIECTMCHLDIQHKIVKDIETIADCRTCHTDLHKAQNILFTGQGGKGIDKSMPNVMWEKGISCKGCHIFHEESGGRTLKRETSVSKAEACEGCHGKGFARILENWEVATEKKLSQILAIYTRASREVNRARRPNAQKAKALIEDAAFNIDLVEQGKSVHNMRYSQELLQAAYNIMTEALDLIKSSYEPEAFLVSSREIPTECANCHAGIEEISSPIFGIQFSHNRHLIEEKIPCSTCHSNVRKHGEFIATKKNCASCHHEESPKDCIACHTIQKTFYQGGTVNGLQVPEDIMSHVEVFCSDCHFGEGDQVVRSNKNKCLDCHEEDYLELFSEWQDSVKGLIRDVRSALKESKKLKLSEAEKAELLKIENVLQKIEFDGSLGIHNFPFIEEFLSTSQKTLKSLRDKSSDRL
ncbi:MAG: cytochrome c3 family protein, partial [Candidatus Aminicenantes bacterium]|nr:cytochrome c3 family protein [Candidatus Aminicenantes bacterium]